MVTLKEQKACIRNKILRERDALTPPEHRRAAHAIQAGLFGISDIIAARHIFIYVSFKSEIDTHDMIRMFLAQGKIISVPYTDMHNRCIVPVSITDFEKDLTPGTMGILEPNPNRPEPHPAETIDAVVTPGIAFSQDGRRVGYGGGFYDRFFSAYQKQSYALAMECQILPSVPHDPSHDIKVNYILTENRTIYCS